MLSGFGKTHNIPIEGSIPLHTTSPKSQQLQDFFPPRHFNSALKLFPDPQPATGWLVGTNLRRRDVGSLSCLRLFASTPPGWFLRGACPERSARENISPAGYPCAGCPLQAGWLPSPREARENTPRRLPCAVPGPREERA
ncbi:hypothetical protein CYMTET_45641 [Cymbomonas tetramitiformis]|uniref:Uncharacterized protein n=1 Tax=Cymbomonas tetramitiformis TaxID=36881 RepID=A0AAE0EXV6_9CHLO|nr:hypothetical protein CYMTET_45641 [Cymbomonas tetramitiformis]